MKYWMMFLWEVQCWRVWWTHFIKSLTLLLPKWKKHDDHGSLILLVKNKAEVNQTTMLCTPFVKNGSPPGAFYTNASESMNNVINVK